MLPHKLTITFHDVGRFEGLFLKIVKAIGSNLHLKTSSNFKGHGGEGIFNIELVVSENSSDNETNKQNLLLYNSSIDLFIHTQKFTTSMSC